MKSKDVRQEEADVRDAERAKRTPQQQVVVLDTRLGKGEGAVKERARLQKEIGGNDEVK